MFLAAPSRFQTCALLLAGAAADMHTLLDADKSLHFTRSWRVGFLVPAGN